jgi:hypothetical protein
LLQHQRRKIIHTQTAAIKNRRVTEQGYNQ